MPTFTHQFSISAVRHKKSLEYLDKWKARGENISEKINRAIEYYGALEEKQEEEQGEQEAEKERRAAVEQRPNAIA
jgi:hypothetical protein